MRNERGVLSVSGCEHANGSHHVQPACNSNINTTVVISTRKHELCKRLVPTCLQMQVSEVNYMFAAFGINQ
jgi:hypothetical protein